MQPRAGQQVAAQPRSSQAGVLQGLASRGSQHTCFSGRVQPAAPRPWGLPARRAAAAGERGTLAVAAAPKEVSAAPKEQAQQLDVAPKPQLITEDWQRVLDLQKSGEPIECRVTGVSRGGVGVEFASGRAGFIPFSLMDPSRIPPAAAAAEERIAALVGTSITAKVTEVNVPERRVVLSERAASLAMLVARLQVGDVVEGVVSYVSDFGAFVMLRDPEGGVNGAEGLVHISELSWEWVSTPDKVVQPGKVVRVKVVGIERGEKPRINLSLKQMEDDPLMETLDDLVPMGGGGAGDLLTVPATVPEEFEEICQALSGVPGVNGVELGRQAEEKRVVSQDLELWITRESVEDGYNLLARAGRTVQEIHVATNMGRSEMKETIQALLKRIV